MRTRRSVLGEIERLVLGLGTGQVVRERIGGISMVHAGTLRKALGQLLSKGKLKRAHMHAASRISALAVKTKALVVSESLFG